MTQLIGKMGVCAVLLLTAGFTAAAQNHTTERSTLTINDVIPASFGCTGEDILLTGTVSMLVQLTASPSGGFDATIHFTPNLTGTGAVSGATYITVGPQTDGFHFTPSGTFVYNFTNISQAISPGSGANLVYTQNWHITVTPDGNVTVEFYNDRIACRG